MEHLLPIDATAFAAQQRQADAFLDLGILHRRLRVEDEYDTRHHALLFTGR